MRTRHLVLAIAVFPIACGGDGSDAAAPVADGGGAGKDSAAREDGGGAADSGTMRDASVVDSQDSGSTRDGGGGGGQDSATPVDGGIQDSASMPDSLGVQDSASMLDSSGDEDSASITEAGEDAPSPVDSASPPVYCGHPADCAVGRICGANGTCHPGPCDASNACIYGYTCANDGTCQGAPNACDSDTVCASGSLCIAAASGGGVCSAAANQCFDSSQCGVGEHCAAGKCTLGCASNSNCRDGYTCNPTLGMCTTPAQPCTVTNDCGNATQVCVSGACVPRSNGGACVNPGDVWDENGCVPNQAATFGCQNDGVQDVCAPGSICLYHDCWVSCDAPNQTACASQAVLNMCKPIAEGGATYNVCGSAQNLGSQCGPGSGSMACSGGGVCIDGFCK